MTGIGDDWRDMKPFSALSRRRSGRPASQVDERTAERLLSGAPLGTDDAGLLQLAAALAALRAQLPTEAPAPRGELAAMLEAGLPAMTPARSGAGLHRRRVAALSALTGLGLAAGLVGAGAAAALPPSLQRAVADVVETLTPFRLPDPGPDSRDPFTRPTPSSTPVPSPAVTDPGHADVTLPGAPRSETSESRSDRSGPLAGPEPTEPPEASTSRSREVRTTPEPREAATSAPERVRQSEPPEPSASPTASSEPPHLTAESSAQPTPDEAPEAVPTDGS